MGRGPIRSGRSKRPQPTRGAARASPVAAPERIQKVLAEAGAGSRRRIEAWIRDGRITVNDEPAYIGQKITTSDRVKIGGRGIALGRKPAALRVIAYKKRAGEIVTRDDPEGRRTVFRKLPKLESGRWIVIGRLDINTSGLLLFTTSGELARRLMHPSFEIEREYAVRVLGTVDDAVLERLQGPDGVRLDDGPARFERVWRGEGDPLGEEEVGAANRWFHVVVKEGRNRLVRRVWESQRCQVSRLIRLRFGPVSLGRGTRSADWRELEPDEIRDLLHSVGMH